MSCEHTDWLYFTESALYAEGNNYDLYAKTPLKMCTFCGFKERTGDTHIVPGIYKHDTSMLRKHPNEKGAPARFDT